MDTLKLKKAWEVALGPLKNLPMTAVMMYMSGNSLQIFSIMMVFMAFKNPVMGILGTQQAFERFESETNKSGIFMVKLAYIAAQLVALALGVWKVNGMGLLPYVVAAIPSSSMPICYAPRLYVLSLTHFVSQHDEIRLVGVGSAEGPDRSCGPRPVMSCIGLPETLNRKNTIASVNQFTHCYHPHFVCFSSTFTYPRFVFPAATSCYCFAFSPRHFASDCVSLLDLGCGDWTQRQH